MDEQYIRKAIGANIKRVRELRGASQTSAANFLGKSASNFSRIERGLQKIQSDDLIWLARHWGVSVKDFYAGIDDEDEARATELERIRLREQNIELMKGIDDIDTLTALHHIIKSTLSRKRGRS